MPAASSDFDDLVALENAAGTLLGELGTVDGHDPGRTKFEVI
jgi:hypothetical protein